ncbi:ion channel protein [Streptomyces sp. NPDC001922]|uniref:ion channel protein n=1 Tax=Streptomyces sp. NPDC001922 TaxID=3364624 RepID=UPI003676CAE9
MHGYGVPVVPEAAAQRSPVGPRALLPLTLPALVVGVAAALVLLGISELAEVLEDLLWTTLPEALGVGRWSTGWMVAVLTATGLAVGLVVWKVPGHAGHDPATTGLVDPPIPPRVVPGLLLASVLALAGGVSLGPENPITAANIALAFWLGTKAFPHSPADLWVALAAAGTVGALFGTPVAAALIVTESLVGRPAPGPPGQGPGDGPGVSLWDQLFAPLVAGGAGAITTALVADPAFQLNLPDYSDTEYSDLLGAMVIASAGAVLAMAAVYAFPWVHRAFRRLRHPVAMTASGGVVLGLLGALGGHLTLFKGLEQVKELTADPDGWSAGGFALMAVVKVAALTVAAASGFRGGRIFPSVFAGVSLGLCAHAVVPQVHLALAVVCGVLGILMAITRQGWLSLFTAAVLASDIAVLPVLCLASLPAWLIVSGRPLMQLHDDGTPVR